MFRHKAREEAISAIHRYKRLASERGRKGLGLGDDSNYRTDGATGHAAHRTSGTESRPSSMPEADLYTTPFFAVPRAVFLRHPPCPSHPHPHTHTNPWARGAPRIPYLPRTSHGLLLASFPTFPPTPDGNSRPSRRFALHGASLSTETMDLGLTSHSHFPQASALSEHTRGRGVNVPAQPSGLVPTNAT